MTSLPFRTSIVLLTRFRRTHQIGTAVRSPPLPLMLMYQLIVSYSLSDDAGGLFKIETSGEVTVSGSLDYESFGGKSHDKFKPILARSSNDGSSFLKHSLSIFLTIQLIIQPDWRLSERPISSK